MDSKDFLKRTNRRKQEKDEIIIDIDDRTSFGNECYILTCLNLIDTGYRFEVWFAEGMKNPHIHIRNIPHIGELSNEEGKQYRILFFQKYIPEKFWRNEKIDDNQGEIPDYSLANPYEDKYHPIAKENELHYKYKTVKLLLSVFNEDKQNFCETELFNQARKANQVELKRTIENNSKTLAGKIASKVSIIALADKFELRPLRKTMRICPFHPDKSPSLSLNDKLGLFHCFGCNISGNIIKFNALLKRVRKKLP